MKIYENNLPKFYNDLYHKYNYILLYGDLNLASNEIITNISSHCKIQENNIWQAKEIQADPSEFINNIMQKGLFKIKKLNRITEVKDSFLKILEDPNFNLEDELIVLEAFNIPSKSKIITWATQNPQVLALPLYKNSFTKPFAQSKEDIIKEKIKEFCYKVNETPENFYKKLELFNNKKLDPQSIKEFLAIYESSESHELYNALNNLSDGSKKTSSWLKSQFKNKDIKGVSLLKLMETVFYNGLNKSNEDDLLNVEKDISAICAAFMLKLEYSFFQGNVPEMLPWSLPYIFKEIENQYKRKEIV